jgi:hypothetical protein
MSHNKSQYTSSFEAEHKDGAIAAMQHYLDAADLLRLLPGGKLNDDLMHAALNYLCMPAGRCTCSMFSWTPKDYPIGQRIIKSAKWRYEDRRRSSG